MAIEQKANLKSLGAAPEAAAAPKKPLEPLKRNAAELYELSSNVWRVNVPAGVGAQELDGHSFFWNGLGEDVRGGDQIQAIAVDRAWVARFEVVDAVAGQVFVRLAYALEGAPRMWLTSGPKPLPKGIRGIERVRSGEYSGIADGYYAVMDSGAKIDDSAMPFKTWQACYEAVLKHAAFRDAEMTRYVP